MNAQERDQLNQLLNQLSEVKLAAKDEEAQTLINEAAARQPDAAYLLVQRTMLLEQALNSAKARIDELQNQLQKNQAAQNNSFLSNDPWAQASKAALVPGANNYQIPREASQAPAAAPAFGGGSSSFLGNVATTAAGVVAGSFLFQGIGSLLGHHSGGFGQQGFGEHAPEQTVINNYYGDDAKQLADNSHNDNDQHDNNQNDDHVASNDDYNFQDDNDTFQDDSDDSGWA